MAGTGAYPGSFNPPTVAHLAIAEAALSHAGLDRLVLVVSRAALGKRGRVGPDLEDRVAVLDAIAASRPWLGVEVTDAQLIADIAEGYDAVVAGADKWAQIVDPAWYGGSVERRDAAVARLPRVLVVARLGLSLDERLVVGGADVELEWLDVEPRHLPVSSTGARDGRREWMTPEAAAFDEATGAWTDPGRYARWRAASVGPAAPGDRDPGRPGR